MSTVIWGLTPHPPLLIPHIGGDRAGDVAATRLAFRELCREVAARAPERLVLVTPHGPAQPEAITLLAARELHGDAGRFGSPELAVSARVDLELSAAVAAEAERRGVPILWLDEAGARRFGVPLGLDHGLLVPLYYLREAGVSAPIVAISVGGASREAHFRMGEALRAVLGASRLRTAVLASGDLSHRLLHDGPYGYDEMGPEFDLRLLESLGALDVPAVMALPQPMVDRAGECGLRPLVTLLGSLEPAARSRVLSYEGPFGVGYAVVQFDPARQPDDPRVDLARRAVEIFVCEGRVLDAPDPLPAELSPRWAAFVCLKKDGILRGCIGTVSPARLNLALEIIGNAIGACSRDPRFSPVLAAELSGLDYTVDVLGEPEVIEGLHQLDPRRYGVVVRAGGRSGVLLPDIEGIDTADEQVAIAARKGGIAAGEPRQLFRFEVCRYR